MDLSGPCPIWEEKKAAQSIGRLGICYRSQLPMMPKSKRGQERVFLPVTLQIDNAGQTRNALRANSFIRPSTEEEEWHRGVGKKRSEEALVRLLRMVPEWDLNCHASRTIMQEKENGRKESRDLQICLPAAKQ